jgi:hypothetical protein
MELHLNFAFIQVTGYKTLRPLYTVSIIANIATLQTILTKLKLILMILMKIF